MSQRISANTALDSIVIGEDSKNWKHSYISNDDVPHCDIEKKVIYSPMFGLIQNEKDDILVRGKNIHEAAHARLTPANKDDSWSPLKANLVNALEDCRIEKAVSDINNVLRMFLNFFPPSKKQSAICRTLFIPFVSIFVNYFYSHSIRWF